MRLPVFLLTLILLTITFPSTAQNVMTPELLWQLGRVSGIGLTDDNSSVVYSVRHYDAQENNSASTTYVVDIEEGSVNEIEEYDDILTDPALSPDGSKKLIHKAVKVKEVLGSELYDDLDKSNVYIYNDLMYRHWDKWADGTFNHVMIVDLASQDTVDIMENQPYHCPTVPFGGNEDYTWHPDGDKVLYVTKRKSGIEYATSTNTDIFQYDIASGETTNLTEGRMGYDNSPAFSTDGTLAWLSMRRDGYESDKNDIIVSDDGAETNLTADWDGTVYGFHWSDDGKKIYFTAPIGGTRQLFEVDYPGKSRKKPVVKQVTDGQWDVNGIVGLHKDMAIVPRSDMNHANELYTVDLNSGAMQQLTNVNTDVYNDLDLSVVEKRMITTTDGEEMVTWIIYPPNFDDTRKYPTLLYCQGGPQGALSQFYSFRWNFQLMAAQGYIVVAPNRRGMPGHGVEWNEQISKDWGGQNMQDYLAAIDHMAGQPYVDEERLGCVGASYGGYSAFYLAGIHEGRFKTFIAHDGVFNLRSMYGTTEELFFVNFDIGGPYWDTDNAAAQKSYNAFNPINMVDKWDTPMLVIQGGKDFRVPIGQGLEAFTAARTKGLKSRLLYFPEENHWVLTPQNGLIWQREFYRWLRETLGGRS